MTRAELVAVAIALLVQAPLFALWWASGAP
jgi:hypothetical protein